MKKPIRMALILLCLAVAAFAGSRLWRIWQGYEQGSTIYEQSRETYFHLPAAPAASAEPSPTVTAEESAAPGGETAESTAESTDAAAATVDFSALLAVNPDIVGWLWVPDTDLSFPLLQGQTNDSYLHTTYNGVANYAGSIFLDAANAADFSDRNTVIYGHNMKDGTMFSTLSAFEDADYTAAHPAVYVFTPDGAMRRHDTFAVYVADPGDETYTLSFGADADYTAWLAACRDKALFAAAVVPDGAAPVVTLSTCTADNR